MHPDGNRGDCPLSMIAADGSRVELNRKDYHAIDNEFFKGFIRLSVAGLADSDQSYFANRQRKSVTVVQGRFRSRVRATDVLVGQVFEKNLRDLPPPWILKAGESFMRSFSPILKLDFCSPRPYYVSPIMQACQTLRCDLPGGQPALRELGTDLVEENTRIGAQFASFTSDHGVCMQSLERKRILSDLSQLSEMFFETQYVYTFEMYQHLFNPVTFSLSLPLFDRCLIPYLNGQPVQLMACNASFSRYFWRYELWHKDLEPTRDGEEGCKRKVSGAF